MKVKSKLAIVALFSCCAIMSMGFANWVITQEGPIKDIAEGGISADNVIYSDDYIRINEIIPFQYCSLGFYEQDTAGKVTTSYTGKMSVEFTVNYDKLNFQDTGTFTVTVNMQVRNVSGDAVVDSNLLRNASNITVSYENAGDVVSGNPSRSGYETSTFTLPVIMNLNKKTSGTETFTLVYTFKLSSGNFDDLIYQPFGDSTTAKQKFSFNLEIDK